tara:strand:+ start:745 stop:1680 length:936 start_codon:yes stop_codon:yes gene_type:complete
MGEHLRPNKPYSLSSINQLLCDLRKWGFIQVIRRGAPGKIRGTIFVNPRTKRSAAAKAAAKFGVSISKSGNFFGPSVASPDLQNTPEKNVSLHVHDKQSFRTRIKNQYSLTTHSKQEPLTDASSNDAVVNNFTQRFHALTVRGLNDRYAQKLANQVSNKKFWAAISYFDGYRSEKLSKCGLLIDILHNPQKYHLPEWCFENSQQHKGEVTERKRHHNSRTTRDWNPGASDLWDKFLQTLRGKVSAQIFADFQQFICLVGIEGKTAKFVCRSSISNVLSNPDFCREAYGPMFLKAFQEVDVGVTSVKFSLWE